MARKKSAIEQMFCDMPVGRAIFLGILLGARAKRSLREQSCGPVDDWPGQAQYFFCRADSTRIAGCGEKAETWGKGWIARILLFGRGSWSCAGLRLC